MPTHLIIKHLEIKDNEETLTPTKETPIFSSEAMELEGISITFACVELKELSGVNSISGKAVSQE